MITREAAQMMIDAMDSIPAMKRNFIHGELKELALTIRELYDKCEGMHNAAIDKAVEVVERNRHKRCTDMNDDWHEGYNEALDWTYKELKKLKEGG